MHILQLVSGSIHLCDDQLIVVLVLLAELKSTRSISGAALSIINVAINEFQ